MKTVIRMVLDLNAKPKKKWPEGMSRQRIWQIKVYREGRCINCGERRGESTYKYHCLPCGKRRVRKGSMKNGHRKWEPGMPGRPPKWSEPRSTSL